jgi:hypothetical protein
MGSISLPHDSSSRGEHDRSWEMEYRAKNSGETAFCMSAAMACSDFLQTSGKCPASLTIPPIWPPMPSAHVLQAFLLRIARHSANHPTRFAVCSV